MNAYLAGPLQRYGCPRCGYELSYWKDGIYECGECRYRFRLAVEGENPVPHPREGILARESSSRRRFHPWREHVFDSLIRRRRGICVVCGQPSGLDLVATIPGGLEDVSRMFGQAGADPRGMLSRGAIPNGVPRGSFGACAEHRTFLAELIRRSVVAGGYISVEMIKLSLSAAKKEATK